MNFYIVGTRPERSGRSLGRFRAYGWRSGPGQMLDFRILGGCPKSRILDRLKIQDLGTFLKALKMNRLLRAANGLIFRSRFARAPSGHFLSGGLAHNPPYLSKSDLGQISDFWAPLPWAWAIIRAIIRAIV